MVIRLMILLFIINLQHLVDEDAKKIARGDLNSNMVFTKALIEHTRSRTNTMM